MLLCSRVRKWLEKMRIVGCPHLYGPFLHSGRYLVRKTAVELRAELHRRKHSLISLLGHIPTHLIKVQDILSEIL